MDTGSIPTTSEIMGGEEDMATPPSTHPQYGGSSN